MGVQVFERRTRIRRSADDVFAWHLRERAFERLQPPWEQVELVRRTGGPSDGGEVEIEVGVGPFTKTWLARHTDFEPGRMFRDEQVEGPFARWVHTHRVEPLDDETCELQDHIEYRLPLGILGRTFGGGMVRRKLERMFKYRHAITVGDLERGPLRAVEGTMKVAISGASGLVGSALTPYLETAGHDVLALTRSGATGDGRVRWDPKEGTVDTAGLEGVDAVVHLAGEGIADSRWNDEVKARIRDSRVKGTRALAEALASMETPPRVLVCASAVGYYGDRGDEVLTEQSSRGDDFLAEVCEEWEAAADPARAAGIRVVHVRIGVVLSPKGGALAKMLTPFKMGAGGVIGDGGQFMSWISIDDLVGVLAHALTHEDLEGPVNAVAPAPVTNREFTKTLGSVLGRPTILPMPAFAARMAFGEMADALLLAGQRVEPRRLVESGYDFRHATLESALRHVLGK